MPRLCVGQLKDYGALRGNKRVTFPVQRAARTAAILRA
jgi:hypothetical protein